MMEMNFIGKKTEEYESIQLLCENFFDKYFSNQINSDDEMNLIQLFLME